MRVIPSVAERKLASMALSGAMLWRGWLMNMRQHAAAADAIPLYRRLGLTVYSSFGTYFWGPQMGEPC